MNQPAPPPSGAGSQDLPFVSVLVPVRNEAEGIESCLQHILRQDYPAHRMEVLVIDGCSTDGTQAIVRRIAAEHPILKLVENPGRIVPAGMNRGLALARGTVVVRVDGHTMVAEDYVKESVIVLERTGADVVGGAMVAVGEGYVAEAIALAHASPFGLGGGRFHSTHEEGPTDTVYMGTFRRHALERVGGYDERLVRGQDLELNYRIRRCGGVVYLSPRIRSRYHSRTSLRALWRQNHANAKWNVRLIQVAPGALSLRHLVPPAFVLGLFGTAAIVPLHVAGALALASILGAYSVASLYFTAWAAARSGLRYLPVLPLVFGCLHLSYGIGYLVGGWGFGILARLPGGRR